MSVVLNVLLGVVSLVWIGAFLRALRTRQDASSILDGRSTGSTSGEGICIVIPARNEEENIGDCLKSIYASNLPALRVVVLDDGSTDGTAQILRTWKEAQPSLLVIDGGDSPLPDGWLGKPWACQRAAETALEKHPDTKWLLFVDADVRLAPEAIGATVTKAEEEAADLLSALGNLELRSFWERVLQPVVAGLILAGNDLSQVNAHPERIRGAPIANGQFMLFRREAWTAIGGHGAVASNVLDDVGLATRVVRDGLRYRIYYCPTLFRVRMYDSLSAMWSGWSKNLFAGLGYSWFRLAWVSWLVFSTTLLPLGVLLVAILCPAPLLTVQLALSCCVGMFTVRAYLDYRYGQDLRFVPSLPLGSVLLCLLLVHSAVRTRWGARSWKGRVLRSTKGGG